MASCYRVELSQRARRWSSRGQSGTEGSRGLAGSGPGSQMLLPPSPCIPAHLTRCWYVGMVAYKQCRKKKSVLLLIQEKEVNNH